MVLAAVMWGASGLALAEALGMAMDAQKRAAFLRELRRAFPWAAGLASAQLAAFGLAVASSPDNKMLGTFAIFFLGFAVLLPALWAAGRQHADVVQMPHRPSWSRRRTGYTIAGVVFLGFVLNLVTVVVTEVHVGDTVTDMTEGVEPLALGILAVWLILNAPWQEELIFRHYLVPRIARFTQGRMPVAAQVALAIVIPAAIFSLGHAGHMEPAWPKLLQTFGWGLILGWARVYLGTSYAVALHLLWNLSAPIFAPFINLE